MSVKKKIVKKEKKKEVKKISKKQVNKLKLNVKKQISKRIKKVSKKHSNKSKSPSQKIISKPSPHKRGKIQRVQTGIPGMDRLIEGGFEKDSTNVVVGGAGSGKTIFAAQFLLEGLKRGESCLFVTFEEKKEEFYTNMARFGWNFEEYEKKGKFFFLEYTPVKVKTMLEEGGGAIETIILDKKITRMVIDSITSFALLFETELEKREAALDLFNMIKKWSCTSLLTLEEEPSKEKETAKSIEFEADSIILIYFVREKGERNRYLEILKMRGTDHSSKIHNLDIGKRGAVISAKPTSNNIAFD